MFLTGPARSSYQSPQSLILGILSRDQPAHPDTQQEVGLSTDMTALHVCWRDGESALWHEPRVRACMQVSNQKPGALP